MKKTLIIFIVVFSWINIFSQEKNDSVSANKQNENKKYICWVNPSEATQINGISLSYRFAVLNYKLEKKLIEVNGIDLNINPLGTAITMMMPFYTLFGEGFNCPLYKSVDSIQFDNFKKINGLQIGFLNTEPSIINGLDISTGGSIESKINGITISVNANKHLITNGLTISVLGNHDVVCNGLQIGLINTCNKLRGFQIGLWNKNQKRSLPLINWSF